MSFLTQLRQSFYPYPVLYYKRLTKEKRPLEISREDIAHYVGTATESLILTLSDFKVEKLIEIKEGMIIVRNEDKLKNMLC